MKRILPLLAIAFGCLWLAACGSSTGADADEGKTIEQVRSGAKEAQAKDLESIIENYKEAIAAKQKEIAELGEKIKEFSPADLLKDEAKGLKEQVDTLTQAVSDLQAKMKVYVDELAARSS